MSLQLAEQIADAVLYEGYVLYPYRASAAKNRLRWQIGLVTPRSYSESTGSDPWFMQTECLAQPRGGDASITVKVRCLQVQERILEAAESTGRNGWRATDTLTVGRERLVAWEEGVVREFLSGALRLADAPQAWLFPLELPGGEDIELVTDENTGRATGRISRRRQLVVAVVRVTIEPLDGLVKVRVRIENITPCPATTLAQRGAALQYSLAGTHTLLSVEDGAFVSLLDPPESAAAAAATCHNVHTWPVLVGAPPSRSTVLSSPIILYDHPAVAPESACDLCDGTEIDEMLLLRVKTMTEDEKHEARATDPKARAIVARADAADAEMLNQLHGAVRHCGDVPSGIRPGTRVRLKPSHRADSMDMFLEGRTGTVIDVYRTLEDAPYVTVALDDDPAATVDPRYRRSLFFHPDELVPLDAAAEPGDL